MNTFTDSLLITSAPVEVLLGLGLFFCAAGLIVFLLAVETGHYPGVLRLVKSSRAAWQRVRRSRQRWLFIPDASAFIQSTGKLP